ncbi:MAG: NUDIX domain-containing protein [Nitrosomonadaceae bacterium]|nr:NUDIX domain-containing protein [Nitrosomonadaceae bacterium]
MEPKSGVKTQVGALVGRFQVDRLHEAHRELIRSVLNLHDKVIVFLGISSLIASRNNPLDFELRAKMIHDEFPTVIVLPQRDCRTDEEWSHNLDLQLDTVAPAQTVTLYGGRDSFLPHYKGRFPTQELESQTLVSTSGTAIRQRLSVQALNSPEFRAGVIWASQQGYRRVIPTVDILIHDTTNRRVLMGKKLNSPLWRFIGGYADVHSATFEEDARREAMEETGLELASINYLGSFKIPDWRYRGEGDIIRTTFFYGPMLYGAARPSDDISEVSWINEQQFTNLSFAENVVEEHATLYTCARKHLLSLQQ